jgi:lipase chaperone LimK
VYRLRAQRVNAQLAAQLAEREQAETAWQRRVQAYRAERAHVAGHGDDTSEQRAATLAQLRAERFDQEELARLEASDTPSVPVLKQD